MEGRPRCVYSCFRVELGIFKPSANMWLGVLVTNYMYCLFALPLPLTLHNITLLYGGQKSYGLKTTTAGTATRIEVKRHSNRPDPILYSKVIVVVGKRSAARSTWIDNNIAPFRSVSWKHTFDLYGFQATNVGSDRNRMSCFCEAVVTETDISCGFQCTMGEVKPQKESGSLVFPTVYLNITHY